MSSESSALTVTPITDRTGWDEQVLALGGHPLQLWGWGEVKGAGAWTPRRLQVTGQDGAVLGLAQVLVRSLPAQFKALSYVPRGPVVTPDGAGYPATRSAVTEAVVQWCRTNVGGVGITLEPDWDAGTSLELDGAVPAVNPVLYPTTLILDLRKTPDELMADMAKKTRQYIRKSEREDLEFRPVTTRAELAACLRLYRQTAERAGFGLHEDSYYERVFDELGEHSPVFAAFSRSSGGGPHDRPVSFVWFAASARTSFELYGGMDEEGQRLRANYGLKWYAINAMRERGVVRYDVNGLLNDGISTFKRGFASHEDELVGSIDVPFSMWYTAWNKGLPTAKKVVRRLRGGS